VQNQRPAEFPAFFGTHAEVQGVRCENDFGVSSAGRLYVVSKSARNNIVTLAPEATLYSKHLYAKDINLIALPEIGRPLRVRAKTRYMQKEQPAVAEQIDAGTLRLDFDEPQRAVTPGQAAVLYDGDVVIGGGTITGTDCN